MGSVFGGSAVGERGVLREDRADEHRESGEMGTNATVREWPQLL